MARTAVQSSTITEVGYDAATQTLEVAFKSGGAYRYSGVSPEQHADLMRAESIGKHFHQHIRGQFEHSRVPEEKEEQ